MAIPDVRDAALRGIFETTDWRRLMREGVIVRLTIRRWRAKTKLELADLGINVKDPEVRKAYAAVLKLGDKLLLPVATLKELENIDSSARKLLDRMSYKTAFGRFVPFTSFEAWRKQSEEWEQRYYELRDEIVTDYRGIVWLLEQDYTHAARQAWNILMTTAPEAVAGQQPERFIEQFVKRVRDRIPSAQIIADSFAYEVNMMQISFPTMVEAGGIGEETAVSAEEVLRRQQEQEQERTALAEKERMLAEMNRAIVEDARRKKQQIVDSFLADLAIQVRELAYQATTDVLAVLRDGPTVLPGQSVRRLKTLIDELGRLNFQEDQEIARVMDWVKVIIEQPAKERDLSEITKTLRAIALVSRSTLMQLGSTPRDARDLDIPDLISGDELRQARAELRLDEPLVAVAGELPRDARQELVEEDIGAISGEYRVSRNP